MNLRELISGDVTVELYAISNDGELASEIQQRLFELGLLDPPVDGRFGPQSRAALRRFGERAGVDSSSFIDARAAARLLEAAADELYPLNLGDDFPSRIVRFMQTRSYWIGRPQGYLNIVYVEGVNENGGPNGNPANQFNDRRILISIVDGRPTIVGNWEATSEPGRYYTHNPPPGGRGIGVARISLGQFKAWIVGTHHGLSGNDNHEALVQDANITVCRDLDRNFRRENDRVYTLGASINQHSGHGAPVNNIGRVSAGCLVGRTDAGHRQFMQLIKSDSRFLVTTAYRFMTTVISGEELIAAFR